VRRSASCCWWTCHIRTSCESRLRAETMGANELLVCTSCAEAHSSRAIGYSSVSTITAYRLSCAMKPRGSCSAKVVHLRARV
jgi:hypothetical protein